MNEPICRKTTDVKKNKDFIRIKAYSGYSLQFEDPDATEYLLNPDVPDDELGQAILESLLESRFLPYEEACDLEERAKEGREERMKQQMERYNYKTKRAFYKNMECCFVDSYQNIIEIHPTNHEKLEGWGGTGIEESDHVKIPADSSPAEVGAALRLAFTRCIG